MKESNSANKFQMLVKLAFVLFWFARALATNETKSRAANQNWNTPMISIVKNPLFNLPIML